MEEWLKKYFIDNPISISFNHREEIVKIHKLFGRENDIFKPKSGTVTFWWDKRMPYKSTYACCSKNAGLYQSSPYINISARDFFKIVDFEPHIAFNL